MAKLENIEGIGATYTAKLKEAKVSNQAQLLDKGATPKGRRELAKATGISGKLLLKWINRADLARIKGVGEEYADLLEASGVDTVPELARRNADNLFAKMTAVNQAKKLVRSLPSAKQVTNWVAKAKELPRAISY